MSIKDAKYYISETKEFVSYDELMSKCSENVEPAYDGMTIEL